MFFHRKTCAIPKSWITSVSGILTRGSSSEIEWTKTGLQRWLKYGHRGEAYDAMLRTLISPGVTGKRIKMPNDEGETYAFFFTAKNQTMYGKICLKFKGLEIIIYSAHEKERDEL